MQYKEIKLGKRNKIGNRKYPSGPLDPSPSQWVGLT